MLPALNRPARVSPPCPSLPHTVSSATAMQWHKRYHLPLGFVQQYLALYRFPSPSPSLRPLPSPAPSHPLFSSLCRSPSYHPTCPPHPHCSHCHCHRQDGSVHRSALWDPPSCHHHHSHQLSQPNSVVSRPGCRLACTASSLAAQSLPCDHRHRTKRNARRGVERSPSWLSADWSDRLDPQRHRGCPTSHCSFGRGFCQSFAPYMSGRQPTTAEEANSCSCGVATSAGIVKSGKS